MSEQTTLFHDFGTFSIDVRERVLLREGRPVSLTPKAFETLLALVESAGRLLKKEELIQRVWPNTFVVEQNLTNNISLLRKILGDQWIQTVPKQGYRFAHSVTARSEDGSPNTMPQWNPSGVAQRQRAVNTIAVLPFRQLGPVIPDDYLGLGFADLLITRLSKLRSIGVRSTSAVREHISLEQDPLLVSRKLKVDALVEGSIQRLDHRIIVTVQVVSADDGMVVWAETFDQDLIDLIALQDSISKRVVESLALELTVKETQVLMKHQTDSGKANHLYMHGRYFWNKRTADGLLRALDYFQQAIDADANYAQAYAGLADGFTALGFIRVGELPPTVAMPKARDAAIRALELDNSLAEAHTSLARVKMSFEWDWRGAEQEFKRAIALQPKYATAHHWYANYLAAVGNVSEAIAEAYLALDADPFSLIVNTDVGLELYFAGDYDQAIDHCQNALALDPDFVETRRVLGAAYEQKGMFREAVAEFKKAAELSGDSPLMLASLGRAYASSGNEPKARQIIDQLRELSTRRYVSPYDLATIFAALGDKAESFDWLRKACDDHSSWLVFLKVEPMLDNIREDRRFSAILEHIGLTSSQ